MVNGAGANRHLRFANVTRKAALCRGYLALLLHISRTIVALFGGGEAWLVSLSLVAGTVICLSLQQAPEGPVLAGLGIALAACRLRRLRVVAAGCVGFFLAAYQVHTQLADRLPPTRDGSVVELVGRIDSLVSEEPGRIRFLFAVTEPPQGTPSRIQLSWYRSSQLPGAGETWSLEAKLRSPRGYSNPGGFDYERWLFRQGIGATGYVRQGRKVPDGPASAAAWLLTTRDSIARTLVLLVPDGIQQDLVLALVLGHKRGLTMAQREILAVTGTSHLLAISGLHIGLVAGLVFWLVQSTASLIRPGASRSAELLAWGLSLAAAFFYACLAGLALPTRRALLMLCLFAGFKVLRLPMGGWQAWCLALGTVCVLDPLAVLGQDLWLSFGAVACIGLVMRGHRISVNWRLLEWGRVQLAISVGLAPVLAAAYGQISLLAPLVNLLLVPWFGLAILPPLLLGVSGLAIWPEAAGWLINFQAGHLSLLWRGLEQLATLGAWRLSNPGGLALFLATVGSLLFLLPPGIPGRRLGLVCWLALLFPTGSTLQRDQFELTVLDVGQGLATVIRTAGHLLVYDTGPAYSGNSTASLTLIPYLRHQGIQHIDGLISSHNDMDHVGGREDVRLAMQPRWELSGEPLPYASPCEAGAEWSWDGVRFQILHPRKNSGLDGNPASCVLLVHGSRGSVLLTGDIPKATEQEIVDSYPCLEVDVVVAPHHGSGTSSSVALVKATSPARVVFAAGYGNRWGFPLKSVQSRWHSVGAGGLTTGQTGAVTIRFSSPGEARFELERLGSKRIWRAWPVSSGSDVQYDSGSFPTRDVRNTCSKLSNPADG